MDIFSIITNIFNFSGLDVFKIFFLLIEFFYVGFAFVLFRQQRLMSQTVITPVSSLFKLLTFVHFIASLIVFGLSILLIFIK